MSKSVLQLRCSRSILSRIILSVFFAQLVLSEFFDSNGRLTQVEYANKASMKGGTVIGICSDDAAVLLTWSSWTDKCVKLPRKIHKITDFTGVSSSGVVSDVNFLTDKMFDEATEHSFIFGSDPPASRMAMSLADYVHDRSISARYRPLGVRMCIASYDDVSKASINEIDAIGNLHRCKLSCIGPYSENFLKQWDKTLKFSEMSVSEMIQKCLENLKKLVEDDDATFSSEELSIAHVSKDIPFTFMDSKEVSDALQESILLSINTL